MHICSAQQGPSLLPKCVSFGPHLNQMERRSVAPKVHCLTPTRSRKRSRPTDTIIIITIAARATYWTAWATHCRRSELSSRPRLCATAVPTRRCGARLAPSRIGATHRQASRHSDGTPVWHTSTLFSRARASRAPHACVDRALHSSSCFSPTYQFARESVRPRGASPLVRSKVRYRERAIRGACGHEQPTITIRRSHAACQQTGRLPRATNLVAQVTHRIAEIGTTGRRDREGHARQLVRYQAAPLPAYALGAE